MAIESDKAANIQTAVQPPAAIVSTALPSAVKSSWMARAARGVAWGCLRLAGASAAPLASVGVWLLVDYVRQEKKKKKEEPKRKKAAADIAQVLRRSVPMAALHGGKVVIERMIAAHGLKQNQEKAASGAMAEMRQLLAENPINFDGLSKTASKLEMSGLEDHAIKMLGNALKQASDGGRLQEAYELQMLSLEMLIYKGEYKKVADFDFDKNATDARVPLYKAIAHSMLDNNKEAEKCYAEFQEIRKSFYSPETFNEHSKFYNVVHDFHEFKILVDHLKAEIDQAARKN